MITELEKKEKKSIIEDTIKTRKLYEQFKASIRERVERERAMENRSSDSYRLTKMLYAVMGFCHQQILECYDQERRLKEELYEIERG